MNRGRHLLLTGDAVGGVWQYSLELAAALAPLGYQVTMAIVGPEPDDAQRASAAAIPGLHLVETGLDLDWLARDAASVQAAERRLAQLAADIHADIVQLHSPALASLGAFAIPVITILHSCVASWWQAVRTGPLPDDFAWRTALVADGLRRSTLVVTPSAAFGDTVRALYGVRPITVHNGRTIPVPAAAMQDHVFTAGRLWDEGKNLRTLDEAAQHIGVPFKAAGPLRAPHGEAIGLRHIHALGSLDGDALARQLACRPVFASAALYEPFGLAVLEAASAGCALVLSDIPTFRELWDGAALFVDPRDAQGFARAIEDRIADLPARIDAGRRAAARAATYTPARTGAQMASLYARLAQRSAA